MDKHGLPAESGSNTPLRFSHVEVTQPTRKTLDKADPKDYSTGEQQQQRDTSQPNNASFAVSTDNSVAFNLTPLTAKNNMSFKPSMRASVSGKPEVSAPTDALSVPRLFGNDQQEELVEQRIEQNIQQVKRNRSKNNEGSLKRGQDLTYDTFAPQGLSLTQ